LTKSKNIACIVIVDATDEYKPDHKLIVSYLINTKPDQEHERIQLSFIKNNEYKSFKEYQENNYIEPQIFIEIITLLKKQVSFLLRDMQNENQNEKIIKLYGDEDNVPTLKNYLIQYLNSAKWMCHHHRSSDVRTS